MSFTLTWTGQTGAEKVVVDTAEEAFNRYIALEGKAVRLTVTDNLNRKLTLDHLYMLLPGDDEDLE